jgi:hypothetical protein
LSATTQFLPRAHPQGDSGGPCTAAARPPPPIPPTPHRRLSRPLEPGGRKEGGDRDFGRAYACSTLRGGAVRRDRDSTALALPRADTVVPRSDLSSLLPAVARGDALLLHSPSSLLPPPSLPFPQLQKIRSPRSSCSSPVGVAPATSRRIRPPLVRICVVLGVGALPPLVAAALGVLRRCILLPPPRPPLLVVFGVDQWAALAAAAASTSLVVWPFRPFPSRAEVGSGGVVLDRRGWHIFGAAACIFFFHPALLLLCYLSISISCPATAVLDGGWVFRSWVKALPRFGWRKQWRRLQTCSPCWRHYGDFDHVVFIRCLTATLKYRFLPEDVVSRISPCSCCICVGAMVGFDSLFSFRTVCVAWCSLG